MSSRYENREIFENTEEAYKEQRRARGVKKIDHYNTAVLNPLTVEDYGRINVTSHVWSVGDRFYKLSQQYYGSTKYWWIIARYNGTPTEAHVSIGQQVKIPIPLEEILQIFMENE